VLNVPTLGAGAGSRRTCHGPFGYILL
jgi:hypothetical protein